MTRLKPEAVMMTLDQALIRNTEERSPSSCQIATATAPNTKPTAAVILLGRKTDLFLASARRYFGFGDKNDYVVLGGDRVIGRIFRPPQAPDSHPWFWTITPMEFPSSSHNKGYSATREEAMTDFKARWLSQ
jgi:hypothetical protein